jgi:hypothetical protein
MSALNGRTAMGPPFSGTLVRGQRSCDAQLVTHRRMCSDQTRYVCCAGLGAMRNMQRPGEGVRKPADAV